MGVDPREAPLGRLVDDEAGLRRRGLRAAGRWRLGRFLIRRIIISAITLFGVIAVVFLIVRVLPGDPARLRAGPYATAQQVRQTREELGLSSPLYDQFGRYLVGVLELNLGTSIETDQPVSTEIADRLPATAELSLLALTFAVGGGVALGVLAASREGGAADRAVRALIVVGTSTPVFWLGLILILVFYSTLHWAPAPLGRLPVDASPPPHLTGLYTIDALLEGRFGTFLAALENLALPAATLGFVLVAPIANVARTAIADALRSDYVRTARIIGVSRFAVLWNDALRNALLPVITTVGAAAGHLLGGNVLVEQVYSFPGIGQLAWMALGYKDIDVLQGCIIVYGLIYIVLNILVDLAYCIIDPRVRLSA